MLRNSDQSPLRKYLYSIVVFGVIFLLIGIGLLTQAYATVNATAITETLDELRPNSDVTGNYHIIWIILFGSLLVIFMGLMFRMREQKETSFFSISALIMAITLTLLLLSPVNFDILTETTNIHVTANQTQVFEASVDKTLSQIIIIPYDNDMRFVLTSLLTGVSLFNGLYTIFILTNFRFTK